MEFFDPDNSKLTEHLGAAADGIEATPDLGGVIAGAERQRRRSRSVAFGGAAAVVALGIGGVVMVASRDTNELPAAQPEPVVVPLTTMPAETASTEVADEIPASTYVLPDDEYTSFPFQPVYDPNAVDPAEAYLAQTEEIYQRDMPSGYDLQIRQSTVSYGDLFGIDWDLPTGSAAECLGGPAVFIGNPVGPPQWLSTWTVQQWWPIGDAQDFQVSEHYTNESSNIIVRTELPALDAALVFGTEAVDTASFVNGVAVIEMPAGQWGDGGYVDGPIGDGGYEGDAYGPFISVSVESADGTFKVQTMALYSDQYGSRTTPDACQSPPFPGEELPQPGTEQPADPAGAEAAIRERHAILVDRSLADDERPTDLLTDDAGVADARAQMESGTFADSAAAAVYTIDDLVFTDAERAFFEYTIVAPAGTFGPRFGEAVFNGDVWQITRATICQDLSLAGGQCDGNNGTETVRPPLNGGVEYETAVREWEMLHEAYSNKLTCNPINPCGEFDLSGQLPEPGVQPDDSALAKTEVATLMRSMYGDDALLEQLDRIDDPTGIVEALDRMEQSGFSDEVSSALATVVDVVFTSPDQAAFRYMIETDSYTFRDRIGSAVRVDGVWKISRATICNDLSIAGGGCDY